MRLPAKCARGHPHPGGGITGSILSVEADAATPMGANAHVQPR